MSRSSLAAIVAASALVLTACSNSNNLLLGEVEAQTGAHRVRVTDCYRTSPPQPVRLADVDGQPAWSYAPCRDANVEIRASELVNR